ncbi:MAG: hypothetical protein IVW51_05885 [Thermaceae bacterium]|nr:hypothetical protein [Thermaceae bacterium]
MNAAVLDRTLEPHSPSVLTKEQTRRIGEEAKVTGQIWDELIDFYDLQSEE